MSVDQMKVNSDVYLIASTTSEDMLVSFFFKKKKREANVPDSVHKRMC